ncbi:MAG: DUF4258 domain-containing protein [Anaeromyxobacteraceae bacterium]
MEAAQALADIRGYAAGGRIRILRHAWQRMGERGVRYEDVRHALVGARRCRAADQGRWKVTGDDLDGDELTLVVSIEEGVVVVTVF